MTEEQQLSLVALSIVEHIEEHINNSRSGFGDVWDILNDDAKQEIKEAWYDLIQKDFKAHSVGIK
jgi:hypothetical protein